MPPPSQYQAFRLLELVSTNRAKIRQFDHVERDKWARADPPLRGVNYKSRTSAVASLTSGNLGAKPLSLFPPQSSSKPNTTTINSTTVQVEHTPASAPVPPAPMPDALKGGLPPPAPSPPMPRVESSRSQMSKISSIPSFGKIREPLSSDSVRLETNTSSAAESSFNMGSRRPRPRAPAAAAEYEEFGTEALITHVYGELEDDYYVDTESASGIFQSIGPSVSMARGIDRVGSSGGVAEKKEKGVVMEKGKGTRQIEATEGREYRGYVPEKKDSFSKEQGEFYEDSGVHIPPTYQQAAVKHENSQGDHAANVDNTYDHDNDEPYDDDNDQPIVSSSMPAALNSPQPQQRELEAEGATTAVTSDYAEVQQILNMDMAPQAETGSSKLDNDVDYDYSYTQDEEEMMSQQTALPPAPVPPPYESLVSGYEDEAAPPSLEMQMDMDMQGLQYGLSGGGLDHKLADGDDASPLTDGVVDNEYINPPDANYQSSGSSDESEDDLIAERRRAHGGIHPDSLPSTRTSDDHSHDLVGSESDFLSRSEYTGYSKDDTYGYGEGGPDDENDSFDSDAATRGRDVTTIDDEGETVSEVDVDEPEGDLDEDVFPDDEFVSRVHEIDLGDNLPDDNENKRRGGMKYTSKGRQRRDATRQQLR